MKMRWFIFFMGVVLAMASTSFDYGAGEKRYGKLIVRQISYSTLGR